MMMVMLMVAVIRRRGGGESLFEWSGIATAEEAMQHQLKASNQ